VVQQATDNLFRYTRLDRDGREGVAKGVKRAGDVIVIPRDDMAGFAVGREHPTVIKAADGIE